MANAPTYLSVKPHGVTFAVLPSYSYEDFIEGFRPVEGAAEGLRLKLEDGLFNPRVPYGSGQ